MSTEPKRCRGRPRKEKDELINIEKKPRGRPAKYTPEERQEKYKELSRKWNEDHIDERSEFDKQNIYNQKRARNALRLLTELIDNDALQLKDEKYLHLVIDLIKNKKIIYT